MGVKKPPTETWSPRNLPAVRDVTPKKQAPKKKETATAKEGD